MEEIRFKNIQGKSLNKLLPFLKDSKHHKISSSSPRVFLCYKGDRRLLEIETSDYSWTVALYNDFCMLIKEFNRKNKTYSLSYYSYKCCIVSIEDGFQEDFEADPVKKGEVEFKTAKEAIEKLWEHYEMAMMIAETLTTPN